MDFIIVVHCEVGFEENTGWAQNYLKLIYLHSKKTELDRYAAGNLVEAISQCGVKSTGVTDNFGLEVSQIEKGTQCGIERFEIFKICCRRLVADDL